MQVPILIERVPGNGFQAQAAYPFGITAEAPTRDEALAKVQTLIQAKLDSGDTELVQLTINAPANPWLKLAGTLDAGDPVVKEWLDIVAENRRLADADPNWP